ncbi:DUF1616 domain-containing protein [Halohasta salina]|uniref:DUF1616 domain-containing protein n=1 Tax=Halohasta salina TaxID=2961621 RepID=UPI003CCD9C3E
MNTTLRTPNRLYWSRALAASSQEKIICKPDNLLYVSAKGQTTATRVVAFIFITLVASVGYLAANPALTTTGHTEFYLPNAAGDDTGQRSTSAGETTDFTIAIANHEHRAGTYRVIATVNGTRSTERTLQISNNETREVPLSVTAPTVPGRYKVEFQLYYDDGSDPDLTTWCWIEVIE